MKDFKKLIVWQKAFRLFIDCHKCCKKLPPEEKFEMGPQLRRASFSIPSNIAEGGAKSTNAHKRLFYEHALGSAFEVENALLAVMELYPEHLKECQRLNNECTEVQKILTVLIAKL